MSRHDRDVVSLMGGLLLALLAVGVLVDSLSGVRVEAAELAPVVLVVVGVVGLWASARRL